MQKGDMKLHDVDITEIWGVVWGICWCRIESQQWIDSATQRQEKRPSSNNRYRRRKMIILFHYCRSFYRGSMTLIQRM